MKGRVFTKAGRERAAFLANVKAIRRMKGHPSGRLVDGRYQLVPVRGTMRVFHATLITTINKGEHRIAIFSVPKR